MKQLRAIVIVVLGLAGFAPLVASAQNLLLNGSFEAGLANWVPAGAACTPSTQNAGGVSPGAGAWAAPTPASGAFVYMGDTNAPGVCTLSQDVVLPAGVSVGVLSFAAGYNFRSFGGPATGCSVSIAVTDTANVPIAVGYSQVDRATNAPLTSHSIGFTTTPGNTVRVLITETSCGGGPVGIVGDAFVLAAPPPVPAGGNKVPTLDDWAKLLMALLLGASGYLYLRKRG